MIEVWHADILHSLSPQKMLYLKDGYLWVRSGKIEQVSKDPPLEKHRLYDFRGKLLIPGLIDTHTHLPQFALRGLGKHALLPWLREYILPEECKFADASYAEKIAYAFFESIIAQGTTTVCAFLTSHRKAAEIAFQVAEKLGLRAFLGLTLMDRRGPKALLRSPKEALKDCLYLIDKFHAREKLQFVVSPRFALSCSPQMLSMAGKLSQENNLLLQTHLSENFHEIDETRKVFPEAKSYTEVYYRYGCLHDKTLLAHCLHLSEQEIKLIQKQKASCVHCPASNGFLMSGIMPLQKLRRSKLNISLGTDVAAGYHLGLLPEMRLAIESSKLWAYWLNQEASAYPPLKPAEALYLATLGGAKALHLHDKLGNFLPGKWADFIILNDNTLAAPKEELSCEERLSRLLYCHPGTVELAAVEGTVIYERTGK
ncbi:MAG: guanine deaminase [Leptospiraceae bacterium]|nr:guanine deaminase [Leptospiraceae bacterium]